MKTLHTTSRMTIILLCLILCISLFASCGNEETKPTDAPTAAPTAAPTEASQAPTDASEAPTEASQAPTEASQAPTDASEAPTDASEAPTDASEAPTDASEAPTDASEAPTDASEAPTDNASTAPIDPSQPSEEEPAAPELFDYSALPLDEYVSVDLSIIEGMTVEVGISTEITEEDIDLAIINVKSSYESTEITKEIAEDYMGITLEAGTDPETALREYLRTELQEEREYEIMSEVTSIAGEALLEAATFKKLPTEAVTMMMDAAKEELNAAYAETYPNGEVSLNDFALEYYWYMIDEEDTENFDLDDFLKESAEEEVKSELFLYYVMEKKDFALDETELAQAMKLYCEELAALANEMDPEANATAESVYAEIVAAYGEDYLKTMINLLSAIEMIQDWLYESCKVVYVPGADGGPITEIVPGTDENGKEDNTNEQLPDPENPGNENPGLPSVDLDEYEYENPILFHTPTLDGVLDPEYKKSYHFDNEQYTEVVGSLKDENGDPIYNAYTNRSTTYILWDGEFIYVAIERWDDDLIQRTKAYTQEANAKGDVNPWYNETCEVWYNFEMMETWTKTTEMCKVSYDAFGIGDGPFSAISEEVYSNHFLECEAVAKAYLDENPADEEGYVHLSVLEFKIPAKMEGGDKLQVDDFIWIAIQVDDLAEATDEELTAKGYDPNNFTPDELASDISSGYTTTWTRARTVLPSEEGYGGFAKGYLTDILPEQVADPEA